MLYATSSLGPRVAKQLDDLDELRRALGRQTGDAGLWLGTLRRLAQATTIESSTSIEGFHVPSEDVVAIVSGKDAPGPDNENRMAVACYARAMEHVRVMAADASFAWLDRVILDLHFDACSFQRDTSPGRWRTGPVGVTGGTGRIIYQAPDAEHVPRLMTEVVEWLEGGDPDLHVVLRAAMAHLHVVSIHPFGDGNGRIARIVQSLVLAREGLLSPEFASIEEYLAEHTPDYYRVLEAVQGGSYQPGRDAGPWITFCIEAHLAQARLRLEQLARAAARWGLLERLVESREWPYRFVIALEQAVIGGTDRTRFSGEADVSAASATNDFRRLVDAGLLVRHGRGPKTRYTASNTLREQVARTMNQGKM